MHGPDPRPVARCGPRAGHQGLVVVAAALDLAVGAGLAEGDVVPGGGASVSIVMRSYDGH